MDTDSFTFHVLIDDVYKDIAENVETRFQTTNYELNKLLPKEKNQKGIGVKKILD